jgi:3-hydroxybutyryl-CoA dehydrogenase
LTRSAIDYILCGTRHEERAEEFDTMKHIAVIGAGVMGSDLAMDLSCYGYEVILKDLSREILQGAEERMRANYKFIKMMKKDFPPLDELLSRIEFGQEYDGFDRVDAVIENVTEDFATKEKVYKELREVCREDILYGINTSCIPISRIAHLMPKPENVIGMHFLNPVPLKNLVEVIRTDLTSEETLKRAKALLKSMNKTWVVVNDAAGFVTNRVLMLTINECFWVLHDKIAEPEAVDTIFKLGFGHKMGPLATADLIGLDTVRNSLLVLYEHYKDPKYKPCPLLDEMVAAGFLGKKSTKSLFSYKKGARHLFPGEN